MQRVLSATESRILGFLLSAQGSDVAGSTIAEVIQATGLSQNTVYTTMRKGIPGVLMCKYPTLSGAKQYYVTAASLKEADISSPAVGKPSALLDSVEYAGINRDVIEGIKASYTNEPPSQERLKDLMAKVLKAQSKEEILVGTQTIALLTLDMIKADK